MGTNAHEWARGKRGDEGRHTPRPTERGGHGLLHKELSYAIVGAAMAVHTELGPGFLEAVYQRALQYELADRGIPCEAERRLPVRYRGELVGEYQADLVVDGTIIVELKACKAIAEGHVAQALHYLAATGLRLAIILNFGAPKLESRRVVR